MKAVRLYGVNDVRLVDIPKPSISDHEVLLQVKSAGICGTDLRMIKNGSPYLSEDTPRTLGHEFSGVIHEVGRSVTDYRPGMRVAVAPNMGCGICEHCVRADYHLCSRYEALGVQLDGGFAEYAVIPEKAVRLGNMAVLPKHVTFAQASVIEPLSCVYSGMLQCPVHLGDDVLILGAGPIGIMFALLAKRSGAGRVFVANRTEERLRIVRGIDNALVTLPASEGLADEIRRLTNGRGVDVCVTANPSPEAQQLAVELTAVNGRINFFGGLPKQAGRPPIDTNLIHYKQITVTGTTKANNHHFRKTLQFIASGNFDAEKLISRSFPLDEAAAAFDFAGGSRGVKTVFHFE